MPPITMRHVITALCSAVVPLAPLVLLIDGLDPLGLLAAGAVVAALAVQR